MLARKCAVARSKKCILCTPPVAFNELRLTGREETQLILGKKSGWRSEVAALIVNVFCSFVLKFPQASLYFKNCFIDYLWSDH